MTYTSPPKSVEEVVIEVMKLDKTIELFQTVAIMSLNMGNLTSKVNIIMNILVMGEKEKVVLQDELDKERNSSIMWKSRGKQGRG
jgi:hypothetical protein